MSIDQLKAATRQAIEKLTAELESRDDLGAELKDPENALNCLRNALSELEAAQ